MSWKAVLFDMDGVLIDSEEYMAKTGVRALKKYGIDQTVLYTGEDYVKELKKLFERRGA